MALTAHFLIKLCYDVDHILSKRDLNMAITRFEALPSGLFVKINVKHKIDIANSLGQKLYEIENKSPVTSVTEFAQKFLIVIQQNDSINFYDLQTGKLNKIGEKITAAMQVVALSEDRLLVTMRNEPFQIFRLVDDNLVDITVSKDMSSLYQVRFDFNCNKLHFDPSNNYLFIYAWDHAQKIWVYDLNIFTDSLEYKEKNKMMPTPGTILLTPFILDHFIINEQKFCVFVKDQSYQSMTYQIKILDFNTKKWDEREHSSYNDKTQLISLDNELLIKNHREKLIGFSNEIHFYSNPTKTYTFNKRVLFTATKDGQLALCDDKTGKISFETDLSQSSQIKKVLESSSIHLPSDVSNIILGYFSLYQPGPRKKLDAKPVEKPKKFFRK
jgi:hypothetical protein